MTELRRTPLLNSSRDQDNPEVDIWWNSASFKPEAKSESQKGVIRSLSDWMNMVEFWYGVRNNLFHGGKDPAMRRDRFLVEQAYRTLAYFMEAEVRQMAPNEEL